MPRNLKRYYGAGDLHFITFSCSQRLALPGLFREGNELKRFWQARFYDFNVWTAKKRIEKLRYMHRNPVKRGLVASPELWRWSSFRHYACGEKGIVAVNAILPPRWARTLVEWQTGSDPTRAKDARVGHPRVRFRTTP